MADVKKPGISLTVAESDGGVVGPRPAPGAPPGPDLQWIPGGTFHMGSDEHYAEERPVHRVTVDAFWMDRSR